MDQDHEYRLRDLERQVKEFNRTLKSETERIELRKVDKMEFKPVQMIVYGFAGSVLLAFIGALIALVTK